MRKQHCLIWPAAKMTLDMEALFMPGWISAPNQNENRHYSISLHPKCIFNPIVSTFWLLAK